MAQLNETLLPHLASLLPPGARVVVACSGGADSQALLALLADAAGSLRLGALWAVGVDHGLRAGAGAELDVAEALSGRCGVPFVRVQLTVSTLGNVLQNARRDRYAALQAQADARGATCIAVAHTANDQAETLLQRLARGSALRGAGAMRPRRGHLVRPLLSTSREALEAYLRARQIPWIVDPSNRDRRRSRTRVRHDVLPTLREVNVRAIENLSKFCAFAREDEAFLEALAARTLRRLEGGARGRATVPTGSTLAPLDRASLARLPPPVGRRVLRLWLAPVTDRPPGGLIEQLWAARARARHRIAWGEATYLYDRGALRHVAPATAWACRIAVPGRVVLPGSGVTLRARETARNARTAASFAADGAESVAFDADRLHFDLKLRSWQPGDRLRPFGQDGHIKVGDLFTNMKVPRALRYTWPVVMHGDEIAWVTGLRRGGVAPVTDATRRIITLKLDGALS